MYTTVQTEALSYKVAKHLGFEGITPETEAVVVSHPGFHDILDNTDEIKGMEKEQYFEAIGRPEREKFCSVQRFVKESEELIDVWILVENAAKRKAHLEGVSEEHQTRLKSQVIDQIEFEQCLLFGMVTGETDGNAGNYRLYLKGEDAHGKKKFGIIKIDNALSFPDANREYETCLEHLPNISKKLSEDGKGKIRNLPTAPIVEAMKFYGKSEDSINAFKKRVELLKDIIEKEPDITLEELNQSIKRMVNIREVSREIMDEQPDLTDGDVEMVTTTFVSVEGPVSTFVPKGDPIVAAAPSTFVALD